MFNQTYLNEEAGENHKAWLQPVLKVTLGTEWTETTPFHCNVCLSSQGTEKTLEHHSQTIRPERLLFYTLCLVLSVDYVPPPVKSHPFQAVPEESLRVILRSYYGPLHFPEASPYVL